MDRHAEQVIKMRELAAHKAREETELAEKRKVAQLEQTMQE